MSDTQANKPVAWQRRDMRGDWVNCPDGWDEQDCKDWPDEYRPLYAQSDSDADDSRSLIDRAYADALQLAQAMWSHRYQEIAPHWEPSPDLLGILSQIDNMAAGLRNDLDNVHDELRRTIHQRDYNAEVIDQRNAMLTRAQTAHRNHIKSIWECCEAIEDEAADALSGDDLSAHSQGFHRGQRTTAKSIRRATDMPAPLATEMPAAELADWEWLSSELEAIPCWHHGDPSYEHGAYWFRDRVRNLFAEGRSINAALSPAPVMDAVKQGDAQ